MSFLESFLEQDSTQIVAPEIIAAARGELAGEVIDETERFKASSKNITLFRVLNDCRKTLERRVIPLLEMFRVETNYFRQLQLCCQEVVKDRKANDAYQGKIKITLKDVEEFEGKYKAVDEEEVVRFLGDAEASLKHAQ